MTNCPKMSNLTPSLVWRRIPAYLSHIAIFVFLGFDVVWRFVFVRETLPRFTRHLRDFICFGQWISFLLAFLFESLSEICREVNVGRGSSFHVWSVAFRCFFPSFTFLGSLGFLWRPWTSEALCPRIVSQTSFLRVKKNNIMSSQLRDQNDSLRIVCMKI